MSGSLLPNITRVNQGNPLFAPYGGGGGGGSNDPNPAFSTVTTFSASLSTLTLNAPAQIIAPSGAVNFINAQSLPAIDSQLYFNGTTLTGALANGITFDDPAAASGNYLGMQVDSNQGFVQVKNRTSLLLKPFGFDVTNLYTTNQMSTPSLLVSSINNALYPPTVVPGYVVSKIPVAGGSPGANGQSYTLPLGGTIVPLTTAFTLNTNHLYRVSIIIYNVQNNDTTPSHTTLAVTDGAATAIEVPIWTIANANLVNGAGNGLIAVSAVFQPAVASLAICAYNTSATDNSTFEVTTNGSATNVYFTLEDMGEAP